MEERKASKLTNSYEVKHPQVYMLIKWFETAVFFHVIGIATLLSDLFFENEGGLSGPKPNIPTL